MGIEFEIGKANMDVFRRCYIKRRSASTGLYETDWYEITEFVKNWGSFKRSVDDIRFNKFTHSAVTLTMRNDTGAFNREDNPSSIWFGYLTRYRTLVKIEGGYIDSTGAELPADPSLGIFIIADEIPIDASNNEAVVQCRSLVSVFDEVRAIEVAGLGATLTADQLIARIRDHTDGSSNFIFQQFITSTAWTIQSATTNYNLATTTTLGDLSCWALMEKIAEAENYILLINRTGGFEFRDRSERTTTAQFSFEGLGFPNPNIIQLDSFKEALNRYYNFFRLKWLEDDTTTSYVTAGTATAISASNTAWKYGARVYDFENDFFQVTATAQSVVNNLFNQNTTVKNECMLKAKFIPHLEISDKVEISYLSYAINNDTTLWDLFNWDEANWATEGDIFDLFHDEFVISSIQTDLNSFRTNFTLREI
jgi:hypothetical protein